MQKRANIFLWFSLASMLIAAVTNSLYLFGFANDLAIRIVFILVLTMNLIFMVTNNKLKASGEKLVRSKLEIVLAIIVGLAWLGTFIAVIAVG